VYNLNIAVFVRQNVVFFDKMHHKNGILQYFFVLTFKKIAVDYQRFN